MRRAPDPSVRSQPERLQTQIRYQGNSLLQRRNQRMTLKSRSAGEHNFQISRMCDISCVEAVSLPKITVHKQFCCARTVWKDTWLVELVQKSNTIQAQRKISNTRKYWRPYGPKTICTTRPVYLRFLWMLKIVWALAVFRPRYGKCAWFWKGRMSQKIQMRNVDRDQ